MQTDEPDPCKPRSRSATAPIPVRALITLTASGTLDEGVSCSVRTGAALAAAGLHPATGGDGSLLCSGDMLLEALVACAGVTLRAVATSLELAIERGHVHAEGDLDFRGTLGVDRDAPVGFRSIRLSFDLDTVCLARRARHAAPAHRALLRGAPDFAGAPRVKHLARRLKRFAAQAG